MLAMSTHPTKERLPCAWNFGIVGRQFPRQISTTRFQDLALVSEPRQFTSAQECIALRVACEMQFSHFQISLLITSRHKHAGMQQTYGPPWPCRDQSPIQYMPACFSAAGWSLDCGEAFASIDRFQLKDQRLDAEALPFVYRLTPSRTV
jgi:hypothetical protein